MSTEATAIIVLDSISPDGVRLTTLKHSGPTMQERRAELAERDDE